MDSKKFFSIFNKSVFIFIIILAIGLILVTLQTKGFNIIETKDKHGCISSKGYTWSYSQNKCVLVYQEAQKLFPTVNADNKKLPAMLVFSEDKKSADIYLPDKKYVFLKLDNKTGSWLDNSSDYMMRFKDNRQSIFYKNQEIYFFQNK